MINVESFVPWTDLEQQVRDVPLLQPRGGEIVRPYAEASITLKRFAYSEVAPTTFYVLRENLAVQTAIARDLAASGYQPLELEGGLMLKDEDGKIRGFVPPIVEETAAEGKYILDGAHRTSIGRWLGRTHFVGIHVVGIRPDCPGYALPNSWDAVSIKEGVPSDPAKKKRYRGQNYRSLYRDFGALNGSQLREAVSP